MGSYYCDAQELADKINEALLTTEGDFTMHELRKAFKLVAAEQSVQADGGWCECEKVAVILKKGTARVCPACKRPRR